jgi:hypothetical protein
MIRVVALCICMTLVAWAMPADDLSPQSWSTQDRAVFYHGSMGSELLPLKWLQSLNSSQTGEPFLKNIERFGLIPDSQSPDGLPIGLSTAASRDLRFAGRVVGVTCAACHTAELTYEGKRLRIDGGGGLFQVDVFAGELTASLQATAKNPKELVGFLGRLAANKTEGLSDSTINLMLKYTSVDKLQSAGELEQGIASQLIKLVDGEQSALSLARGFMQKLEVDEQKAASALRNFIGEIRHGSLDDFIKRQAASQSPLATLLNDQDRQAAVKSILNDAVITLRMLKSHADQARKLAALAKLNLPTTRPGPGRADDFGTARNALGTNEQAGPMTAPCSIPSLWGTHRLGWSDWDGNTTSALGRSVATALAGGAGYDTKSGASSIRLADLKALEDATAKLSPPVWPNAIFGTPDMAKVKRGQELFHNHCSRCHADLPATGTYPEQLTPLEEIRTDSTRIQNFAQPMNGKPFADSLQSTIEFYLNGAARDQKISTDALKGMQGEQPNQWRTTGGYAARPLNAIWATPPYLHNGSVPTIDDLLKPVEQRPKSFPLGQQDYDPIKLGYITKVDKPVFVFDTTQPGNSNTGHTYGTDLSNQDRQALIEYLKTR